MKISFTTLIANITDKNGYGTAGLGIVESLKSLGHEVNFQDPDAPIELAFNQPIYDTFGHTPGQHRIILTPWESSGLPEGWLEKFHEADEVWATSQTVKRWYEEAGVKGDITVYPHGISKIWTDARKRRRASSRPLRFLYVGSPAPRKGGQMVYDAFIENFGNDPNYQLTIKAYGMTEIRHKVNGRIVAEAGAFSENITVLKDMVSTEEMVEIFKSHDVMVYPSYGEGWGLIPFQAMATGMPTISTAAWADYHHLMVPELKVDSKVIPSPWPHIHPGNMFEPSYDNVVESMRWVADNFETAAGIAYKNSYLLEKEYDWTNITQKVFEKFV